MHGVEVWGAPAAQTAAVHFSPAERRPDTRVPFRAPLAKKNVAAACGNIAEESLVSYGSAGSLPRACIQKKSVVEGQVQPGGCRRVSVRARAVQDIHYTLQAVR